jgi:polysaccharide export outer membrane protein
MTEDKKVQRSLQVFALIALISVGLLAQSARTSGQTTPPAGTSSKADGPDTAKKSFASDDSYVIGADDVLAINVWKEPEISRSVPVRTDGKISLPLIGELQASGQTPRQLEQEISKRLQSYISEPEVTVIVQDTKSQ